MRSNEIFLEFRRQFQKANSHTGLRIDLGDLMDDLRTVKIPKTHLENSETGSGKRPQSNSSDSGSENQLLFASDPMTGSVNRP